MILLFLVLIFLLFINLIVDEKQGIKLEEKENINSSEYKEKIGIFSESTIDGSKIWDSRFEDFENEYVKKEKEKMVDSNRVEEESKMAAEMSIEELQEIINAKKLEESKPAAEMSIEELQSVIKLKASVKTEPNKKPTDVLYIVAILLGLLGGIIGYVIAKNDDEDMANNLLIVGIATSVIVLFLYFVLIASLF